VQGPAPRGRSRSLFSPLFFFRFVPSPSPSFASFSSLSAREPRRQRDLQADSGIPFAFPPHLDRPFSLNTTSGEMTSVEYRSHRGGGGEYLSTLFGFGPTFATCNAERAWRARERERAPARYITRAFPLTALGAPAGAFLIGNFRRQRGGILMARILIRLEFIRSLLVIRRSRVSAIKFRAINCLGGRQSDRRCLFGQSVDPCIVNRQPITVAHVCI